MTALLVGAVDRCRDSSPIRREHRANRLYRLSTGLHRVVQYMALQLRDDGAILNAVNGNLFIERPRIRPVKRLAFLIDSLDRECAIAGASHRRSLRGLSGTELGFRYVQLPGSGESI